MPLSFLKKGSIYLPLILFITPVFFSCQKSTCKGSEVDTAYLDPSAKSSVAYKGHDTLQFLNETSDTIAYTGNGIIRYFNSVSNSTSCEGVNKRLEGNRIEFTTMNNSQPLFHSIYVSSTNDAQTQIAVYYEGINFVLPYENLRYPWTRTMEINGKPYTDIFITLSANQPDSLYYSLKYGVVRLKLFDGRLLQKL